MPQGRIIAIGDIHGCSKALRCLIDAIAPTQDDILVTLGDYIDRGPDSKGVIDQLLALGSQCRLVNLMGNHEEMMLRIFRDGEPPYDWLRFGGIDTLDSYGFTGDLSVVPREHIDFLESLENHFETESHFFVHANYDPELPLIDQPEDVLRWLKLSDVVPPPHLSGKQAIVGHTHDRGGEIFSVGHLICLDTYCYGGGWLTAMDVVSKDIWQSDKSGNLRQG